MFLSKGVWSDFVAPVPGNKGEQLGNKDNTPSYNGSSTVKSVPGNSKYESILGHESLKQFVPTMVENLLNEV